MAGRGYDRHITIFSPEGRLYQIEYAVKAAKGENMLTIAAKSEEAVCVVCQKKVPEKLMDPASITHLYAITPYIGLAVHGAGPDGRALVNRARQTAAKFKDKNGYLIPVHHLASKVADMAQVYTQHAGMRPYAVYGIFISFDEERGSSLFKVDPAGTQYGYYACAAGPKENEADNVLEKKLKAGMDQKNTKELIEAAIEALSQVLASSDLKPSEIEVAVCSKENPKFSVLTEKEIEDVLNDIADKM